MPEYNISLNIQIETEEALPDEFSHTILDELEKFINLHHAFICGMGSIKQWDDDKDFDMEMIDNAFKFCAHKLKDYIPESKL